MEETYAELMESLPLAFHEAVPPEVGWRNESFFRMGRSEVTAVRLWGGVHRRRLTLQLLILLTVVATPHNALAWAVSAEASWTVVKPQAAQGVVTIKTAGQVRSYYLLTTSQPLEVRVEGPARLRAMTRFRFDPRAEHEASYEFLVIIDSTDRRTYGKDTRKSLLSKVVRQRDSLPGKIRNVYLYVPEGVHTYRFEMPRSSTQAVFMRFMTQPTSSRRTWVFLSPKGFSSMEILDVNGTERTYFPVTGEDVLTLEATGPTQLKLLTRWQSLEPMRKRGQAQLQVFQDGALHSTRLITSERMSGRVFSIERLSVIGSARSVLLDVPDGQHLYTFRLVDSPGISAVLVRPFIQVEKR